MLAAVCAAACCLSACDNSGNQPSGGSASDGYDTLNAMLSANYSQITLTVTDTFDERTSLKSEYAINYSDSGITVNYTVEQFAEMDLNNPSADIKVTLSGEAKIEDGVVTVVSGDDVNLSASIARVGLVFKKEYFNNAVLSNVLFRADVTNPSAFLGSESACGDMKVESTFGQLFNYIHITYNSAEANKVDVKYIFTY